MFGVYLHFPFCARRCSYCNFYLTTEVSGEVRYGRALEIAVDRAIPELIAANSPGGYTLALGGGTPSRLEIASLQKIFARLRDTLGLAAEISLEANPEDVSDETAAAWKSAGVTRLTLGVQSLDDAVLRTLGRVHDAARAETAVASAARAGFANLGVDLIFGLPGQTPESACSDLAVAVRWPIAHLSHYALETDGATALGNEIRRGVRAEWTEELQVDLYAEAGRLLAEKGFPRYEVSNYARPGFASRHNSLYWTDTDYLGIGPSAASYWRGHRFSEAPDLSAWIAAVETERNPPRSEEVSPTARERLRDALMMGLRLSAGAPAQALWSKYLAAEPPPDFSARLAPFLSHDLLCWKGECLAVPAAQQFRTDGLAGEVVIALGL